MFSNKLKAGTPYKLSKRGSKGFFYPEEPVYRLSNETNCSHISWMRFEGLKPVVVDTQDIQERNVNTQKTVIWVEE